MECLAPWLVNESEIDVLQRLYDELQPRLRLPVEATRSRRKLRRALRELAESIALFNQRWQRFLGEVDLSKVNALIDGYNRYYLLEKECILRSPRLARLGWRPLEPFTHERLFEVLPLLPVPQMKP